MTELISKHHVDLSRLESTIVEAVKQASGGNFCGLPIFTNNLVLYYNKEIFDQFGVSYPTDGMSWDELMELNRDLTRNEGGVQYYGFGHSTLHTIRMNQLPIPNADLTTNTPTINEDERWKNFFQQFYIEPTRDEAYLKFLQEKKALPALAEFTDTKQLAMFAYLSSIPYVVEEKICNDRAIRNDLYVGH